MVVVVFIEGVEEEVVEAEEEEEEEEGEVVMAVVEAEEGMGGFEELRSSEEGMEGRRTMEVERNLMTSLLSGGTEMRTRSIH